MAYRIFRVPLLADSSAMEELNGFLRSHRVLNVDRRFAESGEQSFWTFCVDYLDRPPPGGSSPSSNNRPDAVRGKVDYRDVLSPADFAVFAQLRQLRKEIAATEVVPVYAVFTISESLRRGKEARSAR